ncbi:ATP-dependent DNA helicase RecQ [Coprinopsis cinerea okayama7|uniref:DNA 3'-5' helicase n=1 Tax=Coprinopsis cinerea (strain Okayama-7 / 130 / ATCC MYA-4618 / FGSC 9003) TaxID=240176 RepID=D6RL40_COPC7|nr:ATP-dependent DNA helicase RecQ [Coprinopsis cinerea okayama7\|eukprot:XP_002911535.1 ATP-dependent DNA helicase RecQ [Coprinopsis cinerea okayama7\
MGKTAIAAAPHAHPKAKEMVTFLISPLIALQEEQAQTFETEFKLKATAINSARGGLSKENMTEIRRGKWQIVVISPELILSKVFIKHVLRHHEMRGRVMSIVVDEAHVVSHWGTDFRKKYGTLGILRALLPKGTPFVAMSATLPNRVRSDLLYKLHFHKNDYIDLNLGNDRPNVSIVVRPMHHPMNTFRDLRFLIPENMTSPSDIKSGYIYADQLTTATGMMDYLYSLCPKDQRYKGFIRPYSAAFSVGYRRRVMELFRRGKIRILICTDAAGMGCNIPDIDIVVQWKLPATVSSFVQRAGRAARAPNRTGLAVLLVEKSVYEADLEAYLKDGTPTQVQESSKKRKKTVRQSTDYPKATKEYANEHGALRGRHDPSDDNKFAKKDVPLDRDSIDEGLYTLVQTGTCRRAVLTKIFGNQPARPTVPCCDICCPQLLDRTRPAPPATSERAKAIKGGVPNVDVMCKLNDWRVSVFRRDFAGKAMFTASGVLSDSLVETLASVGPITTEKRLKEVVGRSWLLYPKYHAELLMTLLAMDMPPMVPKPPKEKSKGKKRNREETTISSQNNETANIDGDGGRERSKRPKSGNSQAVIEEAPMPSSSAATVTPEPSTSSLPPQDPASTTYQNPLIQHTQRPTAPSGNPYSTLMAVPQAQTYPRLPHPIPVQQYVPYPFYYVPPPQPQIVYHHPYPFPYPPPPHNIHGPTSSSSSPLPDTPRSNTS